MWRGKATYSHNNTTKAHVRAQSLSYSGAFPEWAEYPRIISAPDVLDIHIYIYDWVDKEVGETRGAGRRGGRGRGTNPSRFLSMIPGKT